MQVSIYEKRAVDPQEVVQRIKVGDIHEVSPLILLVAPCRSGSTAMLRVFGASGIPSYYQNIKNILRWRLQDRDITWEIPQNPQNTIFLKETLGPYTQAESSLNPVDMLLKAGYPPEKLKLVLCGRTPLVAWPSWLQFWGEHTSVEYFITAYQTAEACRLQAEKAGVHKVVFTYEVLGANESAKVIEALFSKLGIVQHFSERSYGGWDAIPGFGEEGSGIHIPEEPEEYFARGTRDTVKKADGLRYVPRVQDLATFNQTNLGKIRSAGLEGLYAQWRAQCQEDLGLQVIDPLSG